MENWLDIVSIKALSVTLCLTFASIAVPVELVKFLAVVASVSTIAINGLAIYNKYRKTKSESND